MSRRRCCCGCTIRDDEFNRVGATAADGVNVPGKSWYTFSPGSWEVVNEPGGTLGWGAVLLSHGGGLLNFYSKLHQPYAVFRLQVGHTVTIRAGSFYEVVYSIVDAGGGNRTYTWTVNGTTITTVTDTTSSRTITFDADFKKSADPDVTVARAAYGAECVQFAESNTFNWTIAATDGVYFNQLAIFRYSTKCQTLGCDACTFGVTLPTSLQVDGINYGGSWTENDYLITPGDCPSTLMVDIAIGFPGPDPNVGIWNDADETNGCGKAYGAETPSDETGDCSTVELSGGPGPEHNKTTFSRVNANYAIDADGVLGPVNHVWLSLEWQFVVFGYGGFVAEGGVDLGPSADFDPSSISAGVPMFFTTVGSPSTLTLGGSAGTLSVSTP